MGIRVQKKEHVGASRTRAGIHLARALGGTCAEHGAAGGLAEFNGAVKAAAIHDDDLRLPAVTARALNRLAQRRGFIQRRDDHRHAGWLAEFSLHIERSHRGTATSFLFCVPLALDGTA